MKTVLCLVFVAAALLVASVSAKAVIAHQAEQATTTTPASSSSDQVGCGCTSPTATPVVTSSGGCGCQNGEESGGSSSNWRDSQLAALQAMGPRAKPEEVVKPIGDWLDNFQKKELLEGGLYDAAKLTVLPLIKKLKRTQDDAVQRLKDSNRQIREQVENAAIDHVYNLLKSKRAVEDAQSVAIGKQEQVEDAQEAMNLAKAELSSAKRGANEIKLTLMRENSVAQNGTDANSAQRMNTTKTILGAIDKILSQ